MTRLSFTASSGVLWIDNISYIYCFKHPIGQDVTILNNNGLDIDFIVESENNENMITVDASADKVGIGTATPTATLQVSGNFAQKVIVIDPCDTTPDVSGGNIFVTSANGDATAITDLDSPVVGQIIYIIGGSATNSSTIGDAGNFALSAAWTASLDDVLILFIQADNDYIEIGRADN